MNAQELTEKYLEEHQKLYEMSKQVDYLTFEVEKLRRFLEDAQVDIKMLQNMRR